MPTILTASLSLPILLLLMTSTGISIAREPQTRIQTPSTQTLPSPVREALKSLKNSCNDAGGMLTNSSSAVTMTDITGDGIPDYIIDSGKLTCSVDLWGSGGTPLEIFVARDMQNVNAPVSITNGGVRLNTQTHPATLSVLVGGEMCGQKTAALSRAQYANCWRPVVWDAKKKILQLGAPSPINK